MYTGFGKARSTITNADVVRLLTMVWLGNLAGAIILVALFVAGGGGGMFAGTAELLHGYVAHKVDSSFLELLARGVLCNWMVCLAIWTAARVDGDAAKYLVLAWALTAFVTSGFEHSVANMTALALGLLVDNPTISLTGALRNLALVTLGNVAGGLGLVVLPYLAAARTDVSSAALQHDTGRLPTSMRVPVPAPAPAK